MSFSKIKRPHPHAAFVAFLPMEIANHRVYKFDEKENWKIKLLVSLMEIRDQRWEILFDEEEETGSLRKDDITDMIDSVASS